MSAGYTDITPAGGLLIGTSKPLKWLLVDENGAPLPGQRANITLTIVEPDGTVVTKTDTDLTDEGAGVYSYPHAFDQDGQYRGHWYYLAGLASVRNGWLLDVSLIQ